MSSLPPDRPPYPPPGMPPPAGGGRGCWRVGLVGCGIAGLVILLVLVGSILYIRRNPMVITDFVMGQVESHFSSEVTDQDKADLRAAYAAYRERLKSGKASPEPLQRVRTAFMSGGSKNEISRDQVHDLTAAFREAAGERQPSVNLSPGPGATPSPATPGSPPPGSPPPGSPQPGGASPATSPVARVP